MSELDDGDIPEFIEVEITDVIDLHTFQPREVADVVHGTYLVHWPFVKKQGLSKVMSLPPLLCGASVGY